MTKKVLLHICCGPCALFPFEFLTQKGFLVEGFFYNPNIQPPEEYAKRKDVMHSVESVLGVTVHAGSYEEALYREAVKEASDKHSRCGACFQLRLTKTRQYAESLGFDYFTSTLLASPYQDQELIKQIGEDISQDASVQFLFHDFRPGFRQAHARARALQFYSQKYCGCLASQEERNQEIARKKNVNSTC